MADRPQPHVIDFRQPLRPGRGEDDYHFPGGGGGKIQVTQKYQQQNRTPSTGQVVAVITGLPVCGTLLGLSGLTLMGSFIGLLVAAPLFVIFSPVLMPAIFLIALTVTAFMASGALGLAGLSSLSWAVDTNRAKIQMADMADYMGHKAEEMGEGIKSKAQEGKRQTVGRGYDQSR